MTDPARSLEDIKTSMKRVSVDINAVKEAIADLCDHLIAQKTEIDTNKTEITRRPTRGQMAAQR